MIHPSRWMAATAASLVLTASLAVAQPERSGFLGLFGEDPGPDSRNGAKITDVVKESPAEKAGLKDGDLVIAANGKKINDFADLADTIGGLKPGEKVTLKIIRDGKEQTVEATLGTPRPRQNRRLPADRFPGGPGGMGQGFDFRPFGGFGPGDAADADDQEPRDRPMIGIQLQTLDDALAEKLNVEHGVVIADVLDGSPAAKAGLASMDVVTALDGKKVANPKELLAAVSEKKAGDKVTVAFQRDGKSMQKEIVLEALPGVGRGAAPMPRGPNFRFPPGPGFGGMMPGMPPMRGLFVPADEYEALEKRVADLEKKLKQLQAASDRPSAPKTTDSFKKKPDDSKKSNNEKLVEPRKADNEKSDEPRKSDKKDSRTDRESSEKDDAKSSDDKPKSGPKPDPKASVR